MEHLRAVGLVSEHTPSPVTPMLGLPVAAANMHQPLGSWPKALHREEENGGRVDSTQVDDVADRLASPSPPPPPPPPPTKSQVGNEPLAFEDSRIDYNSDPISRLLLDDLGFAIAFEEVDATRLFGALERAREVAGRAAAALNDPSNIKELAMGLPTYQTANKQTDRNRELAEVELFARSTALALRILLGQLQRLGLSEIRKALLLLGAEAVSRRADKGLAGTGELPVCLTEHNVGAIAGELSNAFTIKSKEQRTACSDRGDSTSSYEGTASVGRRVNLKPKSHEHLANLGSLDNQLSIKVDGLAQTFGPTSAVHSARASSKKRFQSTHRSQGPVRGRMVPSEPNHERGRDRFTRSRIVPPKTNKIFRPDVSWERQLRTSSVGAKGDKSNVQGRRSLSPSQRSRARTPSAASTRTGTASFRNSSSNLSVSSFNSGIALVPPSSGRILDNTDLAAETYVASLLQRSPASHSKKNMKSARARSASPCSRASAPFSLASSQISKINRREAEAAARRRAAKDYGNFYSEQYARQKSRGQSPNK